MGGYPGRAGAMALGALVALPLAAPVSAKPAPAPVAIPPAPPQSPGAPASASQQIDDVERAFAQVVAQSGIAAGFRQFAAPDAVMFLPDPVPASAELSGARWPG